MPRVAQTTSRSRSEQPTRIYRGAALELLQSRDPEVILSGPAGTGKSLACLHKLHEAAQRYPGMRGLIVRKTRESLTQSALVTFESHVLGPYWFRLIAANCQRRVRQSYVYPNGSEIIVGGIDKPSKIMSTEFDLIYVQEAIELSENDLETLTSRLRNGTMPYQQVIGDTNPDAATHWLKKRAESGLTYMPESRHEDNPRYWDADLGCWTEAGATYIGRLERLTGVRFLRLRRGLWVGAEGLVYDEWDPAAHVVDRMPAGWEHWRKIRVFDFGYSNPFVCQWHAIDPDGRVYLYREVYCTGRTVRRHAEQVTSLSEAESYEADIADHDAEDRATLEECSIWTTAAHKAVKPGIEAVKERLRLAGDARPRLFILRGCRVEADPELIDKKKPTCTEEEFPGYIWLPAAPGRSAKDEPRKVDDHGLDCLRYGCSYIDGLGGGVPSSPPIVGGGYPGRLYGQPW